MSNSQFATTLPPDISPRTRIIAVLCVDQFTADPCEDGWFVSDFSDFLSLFGDAAPASRQTWMHCVDFKELIEKHKWYLHGNPYKKRKVVLDKVIYAKWEKHLDEGKVSKTGMKLTFQNKLKEEVLKVADLETEGHLLVLLFGHGSKKGGSKFLFPADKTDIQIAWAPTAFMRALKFAKGLKVTMLSTACYSGG